MVTQKDFILSNKIIHILFLSIFVFIILNLGGRIQAMQKDTEGWNKKIYIYLTKDSVKPSALSAIALTNIPLEESPIITSDDILEYRGDSHSFLLSDNAYTKVLGLNVSVEGKAFVVTINDKPIYAGAFWSAFSSIPYEGIVIVKPTTQDKQELKIQLGYPSRRFFKGEDSRNNPEILEVLSR